MYEGGRERAMSIETVQNEQGAANTQGFDNQAAFEKNANLVEDLKKGAPDALKQVGGAPTGGGRQDSALDYVSPDAALSGSKAGIALKSAATVMDQARGPDRMGDLGRSKDSRFMPSNGYFDDRSAIKEKTREMSKQAKSRAGKADLMERSNLAGASLTASPAVGMSVQSKFASTLTAAAAYIGSVIKKIYNNMETALDNILRPSAQRISDGLRTGDNSMELWANQETPEQQRLREGQAAISIRGMTANQSHDFFVDRNTGGFTSPKPSGAK